MLSYVVSMLFYFSFLMVAIEFSRKHVTFSLWFWILSLFTFPLWILMGQVDGWFRWFKILSVLLPVAFVLNPARYAWQNPQLKNKFFSFFRKDWALWFLYAILFLNILEATVKDLELGNIPNFVVGIFLILTIPFPTRYWKFGGKNSDLLLYTSAAWNFLYTTWNLVFVYAEGATFFGGTICILLAAEIYPLIKKRPELYIIARAYTLAIHMIMRAMFDWVFPTYMNFEPFYNESLKDTWGLFNLVLTIPFVFWYLWQLHSGKSLIKEEQEV